MWLTPNPNGSVNSDRRVAVAQSAVEHAGQAHFPEAESIVDEIARVPGARRFGGDQFSRAPPFPAPDTLPMTWHLPAGRWRQGGIDSAERQHVRTLFRPEVLLRPGAASTCVNSQPANLPCVGSGWAYARTNVTSPTAGLPRREFPFPNRCARSRTRYDLKPANCSEQQAAAGCTSQLVHRVSRVAISTG